MLRHICIFFFYFVPLFFQAQTSVLMHEESFRGFSDFTTSNCDNFSFCARFVFLVAILAEVKQQKILSKNDKAHHPKNCCSKAKSGIKKASSFRGNGRATSGPSSARICRLLRSIVCQGTGLCSYVRFCC
uniref:Putative secreted protein n=1 Tax=Ixodes scapularis TaxID=6945 RepID=A0A4D5S0L7_IXOSC